MDDMNDNFELMDMGLNSCPLECEQAGHHFGGSRFELHHLEFLTYPRTNTDSIPFDVSLFLEVPHSCVVG